MDLTSKVGQPTQKLSYIFALPLRQRRMIGPKYRSGHMRKLGKYEIASDLPCFHEAQTVKSLAN